MKTTEVEQFSVVKIMSTSELTSYVMVWDSKSSQTVVAINRYVKTVTAILSYILKKLIASTSPLFGV